MKREKKALREQTAGEEIANTVTHVIGSHLGAAMLALLVWAGVNSGVDVAWKVTCASIFGASVILLYAISSAYHAVQHPPAKRVLKVLDHMAIFFLIAGSYTPFCLVSLRPTNPILAWSVFGVAGKQTQNRQSFAFFIFLILRLFFCIRQACNVAEMAR